MVRQVRFRISAISIFLVLACGGTGDPSNKVSANLREGELKTIGGVCFWNGQIFTGTLFELGELGDTIFFSNYLNGKEHGLWKQFYENGATKETRNFYRGKKEGEYRGWWENGKQKFIYRFEDGEYQGIAREWNPDGILMREATYERGHEAGPQKVWNADGTIKSNYVVLEGRRYGLLGTKHCVNVSDSVFNF
jgi:antitoxin component YwqK of YwqJK toxin-antitoxin module